jgi:hypothetical protein
LDLKNPQQCVENRMLSLKTGREFAVIVGPKGKVVEVLAIHERDKVFLRGGPRATAYSRKVWDHHAER